MDKFKCHKCLSRYFAGAELAKKCFSHINVKREIRLPGSTGTFFWQVNTKCNAASTQDTLIHWIQYNLSVKLDRYKRFIQLCDDEGWIFVKIRGKKANSEMLSALIINQFSTLERHWNKTYCKLWAWHGHVGQCALHSFVSCSDWSVRRLLEVTLWEFFFILSDWQNFHQSERTVL